jgi:hypothetical protein
MKVRIEMEIDLHSGEYDVRFHNLTQPGADVDVARLPQMVTRVLENVAENHRADMRVRPPLRKDAIN